MGTMSPSKFGRKTKKEHTRWGTMQYSHALLNTSHLEILKMFNQKQVRTIDSFIAWNWSWSESVENDAEEEQVD